MTCVVLKDGKPALALISCHENGTFTYWLHGRWVTNHTVPREVLDDPALPESERYRVMRRLTQAGRWPS